MRCSHCARRSCRTCRGHGTPVLSADALEDQPFDLVHATNDLVYYDVFEQALAHANIASMLRPGGLLLTNTAVLPTPPMKASASYLRVPHTAQRYDDMFWYERDK